MFFVRTGQHIHRRDVYARPMLPAVLVFLAFMVIIALSYRTAAQDIVTQRRNSVRQNADFVENTLYQRFSIYEDTLRAANGLFLSSASVSRDEWTNFVNSLKLRERYPGIRAVGYINVISQEEKAEYIATMHADSVPEFQVYPAGDRPVYASLTYVVPTAGQNVDTRMSAALGYDMYSDPSRKITMDHAAASGEPTLTGLVNLVQTNETRPNGFLLFMPLYKENMPLTTAEQRQAAIDGFFYAPFLVGNIFDSFFDIEEPAFAFSIYVGDTLNKDKIIYESNPAIDSPAFHKVSQNTIDFYGQKWTLAYYATRDIVPHTVRTRPAGVIIGGGIFSAALAAIIYLLIQRRTRALTYAEQKKLESAKDELLSLASHQLRTPATAVKQYVSMVKDGFAGDVNAEQKKLLTMAYESNERQLTIVDDLLYVARIDAGQATIRPEQVDIIALVKSVIDDQKTVTKSRHQTVTFKHPRRKVTAEADPQYLRMILENLLSNASKYSHPRTHIIVDVKTASNFTYINFTDQGVGIAPEDYGDVFLKFSRIPNELSRQIAGSGIGLYLAKQLALLHNGDITFTSVMHKGSTFTVKIPLKQPKKKL